MRITLLFSIVFCLLSCKLFVKKKSSNRIIKRTFLGNPIIYKREDPGCIPSPSKDIGKVTIWLANKEGEVAPTEVDFTGVKQNFSHPVISEVLYGIEQDETNISTGLRLGICKQSYSRKSLENVALGAVSGIIKSYELYKKWNENQLRPITIWAHPKLHDQYKIMTDNAMWTDLRKLPVPPSLQQETIMILPHSDENFIPIFGGIAFWEQRAIFSHEFGHHIFAHLAPRLLEKHIPSRFSDLRFDSYSETNKKKLASTAVNENFADMVAYYAHDSGLDPHGGFVLGRKKKDRVISSCNCDSGVTKSLSKETLGTFFDDWSPKFFDPDVKDPHIIGAFIATGVNSIWADRFGSTQKNPQTEKKLDLLKKWVKNFDSFVNPNHDAKQLLKNILRNAVEIGKRINSTHTTEQCKHIAHSFPVYSPEWRLNNSICSLFDS